MLRKTAVFVFAFGFLGLVGCATPKHQLPEIQDNRVYAAAAEIAVSPGPAPPQSRFEYTHGCDIEPLALSQPLSFRLAHTTYC
jgi:hypothetical protein